MASTKETILDLIAADPLGLRAALADAGVLTALNKIGVGVGGGTRGIPMLELHAPHPDAKKPTGVGMTLCGKDRGTRHAVGVTCKDCLKRIAKGSGPPK